MSKLLFISNISNGISSFVTASIYAAHSLNLDFYQTANWQEAPVGQKEIDEQTYNIKICNVPISRNPLAVTNLNAYQEIVSIIRREKVEYIHCNTPTGGILGRLAGKKCKVKKVIYQAHGFHFYKGAPMKNWLLYYPVEKWLARYTDALITINREDYELAKSKMKLRNGGKVYYVPGVGIDTSQYRVDEVTQKSKRAELSLENEDIAVISMGDLIARKKYETAIRAVAETENDRIHYFICGEGPEETSLRALADSLGVTNQIHFLGFRSDIKELLSAADIFFFTTRQEGLPRSAMEAMASGLPCVVSRVRGNTDLLEDGVGGYLCDVKDVSAYAEKINILFSDPTLREKMKKNNLYAIQQFSIEAIIEEMKRIYSTELV